MKKLITTAILLLAVYCWAADKTIYIDSTWTGTESGTEAEPYTAYSDITAGDWTALNAAAVAGDVALVTATGKPGPLTIGASGKSGNNILINSYGDGAIIDGGGTTARVVNTYTYDYITFDGLEIKNGTQYGVYLNSGGSAGGNVVKNCVIHDIDSGTDGDGIRIATSNNLVTNNTIYNCGDDGISLPASVNATDNEISYNVIYDNDVSSEAGDAIEVKATNHRTHIHHNTLSVNADNIKQSVILDADDCIVEYNTISDGLVGVRCSDSGSGSIVRYNKFLNINDDTTADGGGSVAVVLNTDISAEVYGNTFYNCLTVASVLGSSAELDFYGNTVYGTGTWAILVGSGATLNSKNNIFAGSYGRFLSVFTGTTYTGSNNLYYPETTGMFSYLGTIYNTVSTFTTAASETNSITSDPLLTTNGRISKLSPCVDAGIWIEGINKEGQADINGKYVHRLPNIGADQRAGAPINRSRITIAR